jgi:pimeloyl-ACP methyl ester carboxylesterase
MKNAAADKGVFGRRTLGSLVALTSLIVVGAVDAQPPAAGVAVHTAVVDGLTLQYLEAGRGPAVVLLHGYAETSRMWRPLMPQLADRYRVIAPDLPGIGGSAIPKDGLDMASAARRVHALIRQLGVEHAVVVGHDIGLMVAYAYAVAHPRDVAKLVLSEAFIPDSSIYTLPALSADGPGPWHFGFFLLTNGFPEQLIAGNETVWVDRFIDHIEVVKGSVTPHDVEVYASFLRIPGHLKATLEWFRSWPHDMLDNARYQQKKLAMPVLAVGADGSLGDFVSTNATQYASDVTGVVVTGSGHWLYEEQPAEMTKILLDFL